MIKRKLNGENCNEKAAKAYALAGGLGVFILGNPFIPAFGAREAANNAYKTCKCQNNAEWYFDNNSWAQYGGNSAEVYSWAFSNCEKEPLRSIGSSESENSYIYYQKYLEAKTGTGPGGFNPITPTPGGGAPAPTSGGGTVTQQTRPNLLIPALIGAAILFLPFP